MQSAVGQFLTTGKYRSHLSKMKRLYQTNQKQFQSLLIQALDSYPHLVGRYHLSKPEGSFLNWITLPESVDSYAVYQDCLKHKLGILPGTVFGHTRPIQTLLAFHRSKHRREQRMERRGCDTSEDNR